MAHRAARGTVYKRCGCRDSVTGKRKGPTCDLLPRPGHGSWYVSLEMPVGLAGERRRLRLGGHRSRQHAEVALRALQTPCLPTGTAAWTTGRWLRHWLAERMSLRPRTRRMYESHLRLYLLPHMGRIPLAALTIGDVRATFLAINREHLKLGGPLSATTLHGIRCTLRAALNAAIREGLLTENPARWVELPAHRRPHAVVWTRARVAAWQAGGPRPTVAVWTAADTFRFLAAIEDDELRPMLYLVALRGLRRGEAAGLCWPDVDLDEATLTVFRTLQEHVGRPVLLPPKTAASAAPLRWTAAPLRSLPHTVPTSARWPASTDQTVSSLRTATVGLTARATQPITFGRCRSNTGCRRSASTTSDTAPPPWRWPPGRTSKPYRTCSATPASCSPPTPTPACCPKSPVRPRKASPRW